MWLQTMAVRHVLSIGWPQPQGASLGSNTALRGKTHATGEAALLVAHLGVAVEVEFPSGQRTMVRVPRKSGLVVGDDVIVNGERLRCRERRNALKRRSPGGGVHVVCANLDGLGIVIAPEPPPRVGLVDRAVVAARAQGVAPFLIVHKMDLPEAPDVLEIFQEVFATSLPVIATHVRDDAGTSALRACIADLGRVALSGHSGVGKSSLTNALVPGLSLEVGGLSAASGRGRHTTTVATLHRLAGGGEIVDTPGIREYGLVDVAPEELATHFVGFEAFLDAPCRFRDCRHVSEPGCRVRNAVDAGMLDEERYDAYLGLLEEVQAGPTARGP